MGQPSHQLYVTSNANIHHHSIDSLKWRRRRDSVRKQETRKILQGNFIRNLSKEENHFAQDGWNKAIKKHVTHLIWYFEGSFDLGSAFAKK